MSKKDKKLNAEEKIDLLLKYHKKAHMWSMVGGIIKLVLFIVFIVLPVLWTINFVRDFSQSELFLNLQDQLHAMLLAPERLGDTIKGIMNSF